MRSQKKHSGFLLLPILFFVIGIYSPNEFSSLTFAQEKVSASAPPQKFTPIPIQVPEGYEVKLAAGPEMVINPTMGCLDDRGRLFVCENAGVNLSAEELEKQLPNGIRLLTDTDGDGKYDRSTLFADKMTFPMGAAWYQGSLYVASPPYIWKLTDHDGDGVAEDRQILVRHFGYTGNAASIHGCFLGPDGRIYWCDGYHGHEFKDENGNVISNRKGSYLFSCKPDGSDLRTFCGGGMDNPVEVDFMDNGDMLGTVNIMHTRPRIDTMVHWQYGGAYPHREKVLEELKITGGFLQQMHDFGHVAISGTMRYRSGLLNKAWQDNYFAVFFNSGKIVRLQIEPNGSTYKAVQREFLSSTSREFHPTDILEDADGSLLVIDTGGWFYRGCPTSQLAKPNILGAIYRVTKKDLQSPKNPTGSQLEWAGLSNESLLALLDDSRHLVREQALSQCDLRGSKMIRTLESGLKSKSMRLRLNSVWALTRIIGKLIALEDAPVAKGKPQLAYKAPLKQARGAIRTALQDGSANVRQAACHCLMNYPDQAAQQLLLKTLREDEASVRRVCAAALGQLKNPETIPAILRALAQPIDRDEEHALIYALIEINTPETIELGLQVNSANVQRAALIAISQLDKDRLTAKRIASLLKTQDKKLGEAVVRLFKDHRQDDEWSAQVAGLIAQWSKGGELIARKDSVQNLIAMFASNADVASQVGHALQRTEKSPEERKLLLDAIASGNNLPLHATWVSSIDQELKSGDAKRIEIALPALSSIKTDHFNDQLQAISKDKKQSSLLRVRAISSIGGKTNRLTDEAFSLLMEILENSHNASETNIAARLMGNSSLTKKQLLELAPMISEAGPTVLKELLVPFQKSRDAEVTEQFLEAAENSRFVVSLPIPEISDIVKRFPAELRDRGNALLDKMIKNEAEKLAQLDKLIPLLEKGNHEKGKGLFFEDKSKCSACHQVNGKGTAVGPDLSNIGANRAPRDLLESIIFPSATIVRDYGSFNVVLADGRVLTGLVVREDSDTLELQLQTGKIERIPRDDIEEVVPNTVSIMPNGLEKTLSETELADVIAYLISLKKAQLLSQKP